jgi:hypothetical protein
MDARRASGSRRGGGAGFRDDGVTQLAFSVAMLGIPVDLGRLYDDDDPRFTGWVASVADMVYEAHRTQNA